MKTLQLTQGKVTVVDDEDYERVAQYKWTLLRRGIIESAYRQSNFQSHHLHRMIMRLEYGDERMIDHINGNGLDNRKSNLRICNKQQNGRNRGKNKNNKSGYKGVFWNTQAGKWQTQIGIPKQLYLGRFIDKKDAALAYNKAALKHHGEFARLNEFKEG